MIMRLGANSHFAVRLPPGLTSQCISSIMQRHWDPFRCAPLRAWYTPSAQRRGCGHSSSQGRLAGWRACAAPRARRLDYRAPRVHVELSFLGHLQWHSQDRPRRGETTGKTPTGWGRGACRGRWAWGAGPEGGVEHMSRARWAWGPRDILEIFTHTQWTWLRN